jgi:hypothetical protein
MATGATFGPSAGGTGTSDQSSALARDPPFSGLSFTLAGAESPKNDGVSPQPASSAALAAAIESRRI